MGYFLAPDCWSGDFLCLLWFVCFVIISGSLLCILLLFTLESIQAFCLLWQGAPWAYCILADLPSPLCLIPAPAPSVWWPPAPRLQEKENCQFICTLAHSFIILQTCAIPPHSSAVTYIWCGLGMGTPRMEQINQSGARAEVHPSWTVVLRAKEVTSSLLQAQMSFLGCPGHSYHMVHKPINPSRIITS